MFESIQEFFKKHSTRGKIKCSCYAVNGEEFVEKRVDCNESEFDKLVAKDGFFYINIQ